MEALDLSSRARLWQIELPLASQSIMAGIKIAIVINIGFATLGALIGAGGYGQPILTGIRLDDTGLILEGALPAAGLALVAQWLFGIIERSVVPNPRRTLCLAGVLPFSRLCVFSSRVVSSELGVEEFCVVISRLTIEIVMLR